MLGRDGVGSPEDAGAGEDTVLCFRDEVGDPPERERGTPLRTGGHGSLEGYTRATASSTTRDADDSP